MAGVLAQISQNVAKSFAYFTDQPYSNFQLVVYVARQDCAFEDNHSTYGCITGLINKL